MVFYKRKAKFRRRYRRKRKVGKTVKRFVKAQINKNLEYKYHTAYYNPSSIPNNGTVTALINISQGLLDIERVGDEIKLRTITFRYTVTVADNHNFLRFIIFQFKTSNVFPPSVSSVLNGTSPTHLSQYNVDNRSNYQVLYDRTHVMDTDDPAKIITGRVNMKYCKRKLQFIAGSPTQGTNMIYALAISDSSAAPNPSIIGEINFWYTDA